MALAKHRFIVTREDASKRLDHALFEWLSPLAPQSGFSRSKVRTLIVAGSVYINARRSKVASQTLLAGSRVEVFIDWKKLLAEAPASGVFRAEDLQVLFEDEDLIAVMKPPGLPTQPTVDPTRDHLFGLVKKRVATSSGKPDPYVGLHHRLDRDTSGVVVFTKQTRANLGIAKAFSEHTAQKTYLAYTPLKGTQKVPATWQVENYLGKLQKKPGESKSAPSRYGAVRSGGDFAKTDFSLRERYREGVLWECRPKTGRTHQIRVHLSEAGLPIAGDSLYGVENASVPRLLLHALKLELLHPITGVSLCIEAPLPTDFLGFLKRLNPVVRGD
jgi:RluA family pseudouridine synthase